MAGRTHRDFFRPGRCATLCHHLRLLDIAAAGEIRGQILDVLIAECRGLRLHGRMLTHLVAVALHCKDQVVLRLPTELRYAV